MGAAKILEDALALEPAERARLAAKLIESLDADLDEDDPDQVEAAWRSEVASRVRELDDGTVEAIEWTEARGQIVG